MCVCGGGGYAHVTTPICITDVFSYIDISLVLFPFRYASFYTTNTQYLTYITNFMISRSSEELCHFVILFQHFFTHFRTAPFRDDMGFFITYASFYDYEYIVIFAYFMLFT